MKKYVISSLIIIILINIGFIYPVFAEQNNENFKSIFEQQKNDGEQNEEDDKMEQLIQQQLKALQKIKEAIQANKLKLKNKNETVDATKEKLNILDKEITKLSDLIDYYDSEIGAKETIIASLNKQITEKETKILLINEKIDIKEIELKNQKDFMSEILNLIYSSYDSQADSLNNKSPLKALLSNKSMSEFDQEITYLGVFQETSEQVLKKLKINQDALLYLKEDLKAKKEDLKQTKTISDDEKQNLEALKKAKEKTLESTKKEKFVFEERLNFAKKEEDQIIKETEILFKTLQLLNEDLDRYKYTSDIDIEFAYEIREKFQALTPSSDMDLIWPVSPYRGITALFNDPNYPFKSSIGNHTGTDIRVPQSSPLLSPMTGIITYANGYNISEDNPKYYAYHKIIITDENGNSVVLGHVSETFVKKGDIVAQGDLVGLSGGMPGTKGAGPYTTGSHLHLEYHITKLDKTTNQKQFLLVDPLIYFPIESVPIESLNEIYLVNLLGKREEVYENR
ncbi:hypothetical protein A2335_04475 [Candidatus Peregrinibacteria bacterium RIFOXYB2_FULL_32_7]|nr:MAG: hypothetical protein A2335_04475 [Candidatus Peregrinibacteria bacterium RIFOXYB2_FULL_32_7]